MKTPLERQECSEFHRQLSQLVVLGSTKHLAHFEWIHVANERKTSMRYGALLRQMGVKPGVPDYFVWGVNGESKFIAFLEFKRSKGTRKVDLESDRLKRLTPDQRAFRDRQVKVGIYYAIPYTAKEAIDTLFGWGLLKEGR
jgi:hypothetical protein